MENIVYVGFESKPVEGWQQLVLEPVAPASYVKADTIANWMTTAKKKQEQAAATNPLTGQLKKVVIMQGKKLMSLDDGDDPLAVLSNEHINGVVGLDISTFLDLAISKSIDQHGKFPWQYHWAKLSKLNYKPYFPLDTRVRAKFVLDPLNALNGGDYSGEEIPLICKRFKITMPEIGGAMGAVQLAVAAGRVLGF